MFLERQVFGEAGAIEPARGIILIDETGSHFDEQADVLSASDSTLGRLVALAIPAATALPPLTGFHAVAATVAETDAAVGTLLGQKVGVFGFTVQDPAIHATRWIGHVVLLARWVLAQLPLVADAPCEVEILIEQNKGYQPGDDLRALREMLSPPGRSAPGASAVPLARPACARRPGRPRAAGPAGRPGRR